MTSEEEQAHMRRATTPAAATVAQRGLLALLVAVVGLLCLLGRPSPQDAPPAGATSVSQAAAATAVQPSADEGSAPCGKKLVAAEDVAPRSAAATGTLPAPGSPQWTDGPVPTAGSGASFCRGGPAPPHPVTTFSVLRM
ncbi:hypothetical protein [Streptomyces sp. NPDC102283]|uniref:hypothetical protein n=1 Tax=Streptomyces sp. NPDC102283 TaxID=3366155 RepID=UPI0038193A4A